MRRLEGILPVSFIALGLSVSISGAPSAAPYVQTDLVSDLAGLATITEPTLVNPCGISHSAASPFWISDQGTNFTNLWSVTGQTNVTKVTAVNPPTGNIAIPTSGSGPAQGPTGQVANQNPSPSSFPVGNGGNGGSAHFIFANLNGTINPFDLRNTNDADDRTSAARFHRSANNLFARSLWRWRSRQQLAETL